MADQFERYISANGHKPTEDELLDVIGRQLMLRRRALILELRGLENELVTLGLLKRTTFPIDKNRTSMLR